MGAIIFKSDKDLSKMLISKKGVIASDEELALHIMHRFNIDRETLETMPAFQPHLKPLFSPEKDE